MALFSPPKKPKKLINVLRKKLNQRSADQGFTSLVEEKYYVGNVTLLWLLWKSRRWISWSRAGEEGEGVRQGDFGDATGTRYNTTC